MVSWPGGRPESNDPQRPQMDGPDPLGRSGERLLRYANIQTRKKSFLGRCGLGAVMGSKLLKGIAVKGTQEISVHNAQELAKLKI